MAKAKGNLIGAVAFLIGVLLALVSGLFGVYLSGEWIWWVLIIAGIIIGLFNVTGKEANTFLVSSAVLIIVSFMGQTSMNVIPIIGQTLGALLVLFVPATIIVALKRLFVIARS